MRQSIKIISLLLSFISRLEVQGQNLRLPAEWEPRDTIYRIPATGYLNYFVSNDVVLIPKYWKPGMTESQRKKDEEAREIFVRLFPGRQVVQIYTLSINRGGGGIHCMTHEQPKSGG